MRRPTVLHVARDWALPSERFVRDLVATTTSTRAVVVCGRIWSGSPAGTSGRVYDLGLLAARDANRPRNRRLLRGALAGIALAERAEVLHAHFGYWGAHVGRTAGRLHRPWILSLHGHDLLVEDSTSPERSVLRQADLVAVPSAFLADAASRAGFPDERIRVLPSGVDLAELPFRGARTGGTGFRVAFVGRFVEKKGLFDAVHALARAADEVSGLSAVFVGAGPLEQQLKSALRAVPMQADVRDGRDREHVLQALQESDVLIAPSRVAADGDAESLGIVTLEAQARGLPVVATRHGGLVEAVSADAGIFVDEGDVPAMTAAVVHLARHPRMREEMAAAGRRHVASRYELGARTAAVEAAYRAVISRRAPRPSVSKPPPSRDVAVVMVTHNRRDLCRRAVAAVQAQTHRAASFVVVDNASNDGTANDLQDACAQDKTLHVITASEHLPPAVARNLAVRTVSSDVVAFTDDDCYPTPTWLEAILAGFAVDQAVGIVQGRTTADPAGWVRPLSRSQWTPAEYGLYETANIAYRRDVLQADPFDADFAGQMAAVLGRRLARYPFGEDTELAWRVKRTGVRSVFSATAVVQHHVYDPDIRYLLRRALIAAGFPLLVRRVPELRDRFLWHRVFLGPRHAQALSCLAGLVCLRRAPRTAAALSAPYVAAILLPLRKQSVERLRATPALVTRDFIEVVAVAVGAVRARTAVL